MTDKYILEGHEAVPCDDLMAWGRWYETAERQVDRTEVGHFTVSTVFLGLDHGWSESGPPILFETMMFTRNDQRRAEFEDYQTRCSTWDEAVAMHAEAVRVARAALD
jgi:hypothetical protein